MIKITCFDGDYDFLSNFYPCVIEYKGRIFTSSEAAFQSEKCILDSEKDNFVGVLPSISKKMGKKVALRSDWESVKEHIMYEIVLAKFTQNQELAEKLLATQNAYLIEGNYWKDKFWGVCPETGTPGVDGLNVLGQILMRVRAELKYKTAAAVM